MFYSIWGVTEQLHLSSVLEFHSNYQVSYETLVSLRNPTRESPQGLHRKRERAMKLIRSSQSVVLENFRSEINSPLVFSAVEPRRTERKLLVKIKSSAGRQISEAYPCDLNC